MNYRNLRAWKLVCARLGGWWYASRAIGQPPRIHPLVQIGFLAFVVILAIAVYGDVFASWSPAQHQAVVQYILLLLTLSAGLVAIWYTFETRGIRLSSDKQTRNLSDQSKSLQRQLNLMGEQHRATFLPYLVPAVYSREALASNSAFHRKAKQAAATPPFRKSGLMWQSVTASESGNAWGFEDYLRAVDTTAMDEAVCVISNMSERVAYTVWAYAETNSPSKVVAAASPLMALAPKTAAACELTANAYGEPETPLTQQQVDYILHTLYGHDLETNHLTQRIWSHRSHVVVTFQTYDGEVYAHVTETAFAGLGEVEAREFSTFKSHLIRLERHPSRQQF